MRLLKQTTPPSSTAPEDRYIDKVAARLGLRAGALLPLPGVATRNMWPTGLSNGTDTAANYRIRHQLTAPTTEVRVVYTNQAAAEDQAVDPITVAAGLEAPDGTTLPVYFRGARTVVIPPGGIVTSDPVAVTQDIATFLRSRTYVSVTSGQRWPVGFFGTYFGTNEDGGEKAASGITDKTLSGTIPVTGSLPLYGPTAIIGRFGAATWTVESYGVAGDSIAAGQGDSDNTVAIGSGFLARALGGTRPLVNVALPGELGSAFAGANGSRVRRLLLQGSTRIVCQYGRNDLTGGASAAVVEATQISIWRSLAATGAKVYQTTITPKSTSTDGWLTTAGQTTDSSNAARATLNQWLRDGAPILANGSPAAVGSVAAGTVRAGAVGHPLVGVFDVAAAVESATDSGLWAPDPGYRTISGASMTASSNSLTTATAQFTSADLKKFVRIPGAGASGADLIAQINFFNGTSSLGLSAQAQTTVSGVGGFLGNRYSGDGTHPNSSGHAALAGLVNVTAMDTAA